MRIFGVLQRLALTYALGMVLAKMAKTESRVFVFAALLLLLSSAGYHIYAPAAPFALPDNISRAVDVIVPGAAHVSQHYGLPFDPEGLYGTMSSAASMLFGLLAGHVLKEHSGEWEKGMLLAFGGAALDEGLECRGGYAALCGFGVDFFPVALRRRSFSSVLLFWKKSAGLFSCDAALPENFMVDRVSCGRRSVVRLDMAAYGDGGWRYGVQHGAFCRFVVRAVVAAGRVDVSTGDCRQTVKFDEDSGTKKKLQT